jgi:hypothetical protein
VASTTYDPIQRPIYWFALLEQAIDRGDLQAAAHAQEELAKLGVRVRYGRRLPEQRTNAEGEAVHAK